MTRVVVVVVLSVVTVIVHVRMGHSRHQIIFGSDLVG